MDQYEVVGTLGSGNSGTVKVAYEPEFERYVAIKEFSPTLVGDPYFLQRLRSDAEQLKRLDSPNCVAVYDFIETPTRAWLISEYVEGASLRRILDRSGFLSPEQALGVIKGTVNGLGHGHSLGLVHRDVKPANVILNREGLPKLTDFGQALVTPGSGSSGGSQARTPAYMSPEQVTGGTVDHRSDIYSCGAMLFECLTGKTPYHAEGAAEMMRMHVNEPVPDPRKLNADLPRGVADTVMRAMAKDPADRQPTAFQFLADLEQAAVAGYGEGWQGRASVRTLVAALLADSGAPPLDRIPPPPGGEGPILAGGGEWWRNRWVIVGGAAAALLLISGVAFAFGAGGHNSDTGGVAIASPSPSASAQESPSPNAKPSPAPSLSPSPSPSPSPKPSPSPTPSPAPPNVIVDMASMSVWFSCSPPIIQQCSSTVADGSSYSSPVGSKHLNCGTEHLSFYEKYSWTDPDPPGTASVQFTVHWWNSYPGATAANEVAHASSGTANPGDTNKVYQATTPTYDATDVPGSANPSPGYVYFNLTWTMPGGGYGSQGPSPKFYYTCT